MKFFKLIILFSTFSLAQTVDRDLEAFRKVENEVKNKNRFSLKFSPQTTNSSSGEGSTFNPRLKKTNGNNKTKISGRRSSKESLISQMDQDEDNDNIGDNAL